MLASDILIYTTLDSPRLRFVLEWLFRERLGLSYKVMPDKTDTSSAYTIGYGNTVGGINIFAAGLLSETGTKSQRVSLDNWQDLDVLYNSRDNKYTIPFDLFSGIFYLLSRYEEYLDFSPDRHGRFPHTSSILNSVLERPVVDEWVDYFRKSLEQHWNISIPGPVFSIEPTYDIDIAWAYRNKGLKRFIGSLVKDLATLRLPRLFERLGKDPYDAFGWMRALHQRYGIKPKYFILAALEVSAFDKNISLHQRSMRVLVKALSMEGEIGTHPSYYTEGQIGKLRAEKEVLEQVVNRPIMISRQHYIRLRFPETYRQLMAVSVTEDYSMGYSTHIGFRAGTSQSFNWYDLDREKTTGLRIHPFCFMDTTARFDMALSPEQAFNRLHQLSDTLMKIGGKLTTVFHNFSLGTDRGWKDWREQYETLLKSK